MDFRALGFATVSAVGALAASAPAMAQDGYRFGPPPPPSWGYRPLPASYGEGFGLRDREDRLQVRIDRARDGGALPGWRAWHAQGELDSIRRAERELWSRQGGVGPGQTAWLSGRLDHLARYIREDGYEQPSPRW